MSLIAFVLLQSSQTISLLCHTWKNCYHYLRSYILLEYIFYGNDHRDFPISSLIVIRNVYMGKHFFMFRINYKLELTAANMNTLVFFGTSVFGL